jgi:transcriptional regulator with XRE-family HTH domain
MDRLVSGDEEAAKGGQSATGDGAPMDPVRFGSAIRALRRQRGWRQIDLAAAAGVSHDTVSRAENGRLAGLLFGSVERIATALGATIVLDLRWRGGALDRLLDERHAALAGVMMRRLRRVGWEVQAEVSYSHYGERGSIDLLGWHAASASLVVIEVKTQLASVEETLRKHDEKVRLARQIAGDRFGWRARQLGRLLVLPAENTARRRVARHSDVLDVALPARGPVINQWLARPAGALSGILFVPVADEVRTKQGSATPRRVRVPRTKAD